MDKSERREIETRLAEICEENDGRITPELIVAESADPKSPLHRIFEWDEAKAAHSYRLDQARALLRSVRIVIRREDRRIVVPYYVRDPDAGEGQGYCSIASVKSERSKAEEVANHEFKMASGAMERARAIADALGIEKEVDEIVERLGAVREMVSSG